MKAAQLPHLRAISHLTDVVARASDAGTILDEALDVLLDALEADRAAVLLADAAGVMRFRAWRNLSDGYRAAADGHSPWSAATPNPAPVLVPDVRNEPSLAALRERCGNREASVIPLLDGRIGADAQRGVMFDAVRFGDYLDRLERVRRTAGVVAAHRRGERRDVAPVEQDRSSEQAPHAALRMRSSADATCVDRAR